jgi:uncharacterized DUF497 family protein
VLALKGVGFECDEESKAGINFRKHGCRIPEAIPVFDDSYAITIVDDTSDPGEQRFITRGMGAAARGEHVELSPYVPRKLTNARSMRHIDEGTYDFSKGKRGRVLRPEPEPVGKARITIRLDQDIVDRFF